MKNKIIIIIIFIILIFTYSNYFNKHEKNIIKIIQANKLIEKLKNGDKIFIFDVRDERFFKFEHIKNAKSFPYINFQKLKTKFIKKFKPNDMIVLYCDSSVCSLSYYTAIELIKLGYKNVFILKGGIDEWEKKSYPIFNFYGNSNASNAKPLQ